MQKLLVPVCLLLFMAVPGYAQLTDGNYPLSLNESLITWKVDYSIGTKGHEGTLTLVSGNVVIKEGRVQGGNFVIDMNSVHVTDLKPHDGGKDLEEHLKSNDFLSTADFPKGFFTVLNVERKPDGKTTISGYLILKGISNTLNLPAVITESKTSFLIKAEVTVNRTRWGINYQSGIIGTLKDEAISDDMHITLSFVFKKPE